MFFSYVVIGAFKNGSRSKPGQISRLFHHFLPLQAPRRHHFPHYGRTSPALESKHRRAIHRFDKANSVTI